MAPDELTSESSLDGSKESCPNLRYQGYHHVTWYVGNAKQAAAFYAMRMGFRPVARRGLETGSRHVASHVISNGDAVFVLTSPLRGRGAVLDDASEAEKRWLDEIHDHIEKHGDSIKDVAFKVNDARAVYEQAVSRGATSAREPSVQKDDDGEIVAAAIQTYGHVTHTLVECSRYSGAFLPGFQPVAGASIAKDSLLPPVRFANIDHVVGNQDWNEMEQVCEYYERCLGFHRFWSVDDRSLFTEFSAMNSIVMASPDEVIKMPINEPALGKKRSQIEEFVHFHNGAGVQHVAFRTDNILETVRNLQARGMEFIQVPPSYYHTLRNRLSKSSVKLEEDLRAIQKLSLLLDFDDGGYLIQTFTKPLMDRPTAFLEVIQRNNFDGFGAGNFKALFECLELGQLERGTL